MYQYPVYTGSQSGVPPALDVSPTVGFIPTPLHREDGLKIDPSVSVPNAAAHSPTATATPLPELDRPGAPRGTYGDVHCPPRAEKPFGMSPRKFAHSARLALPRMIAPAAVSLDATVEGTRGQQSTRANEPWTGA